MLDVGAGFGRHAFECARRGGRVVALDYAADEVVADTRDTFGGDGRGRRDHRRPTSPACCAATRPRLPFADGSFDVVITSEVLEHIQDDVAAIAEMVRVLQPGGMFAATVPSWFPEKINWMLSDEYHAPTRAGGHVRIYSRTELTAKLRAAGLDVAGSHHAHALHSPYWWLKCAVGPQRRRPPAGRRATASSSSGTSSNAAALRPGSPTACCRRCSARARAVRHAAEAVPPARRHDGGGA